MSRLIVKGLPANCTEQKLREFFKKYGQITDCSLKYTPEGVFRRFAFVGFDSDVNANKAQSSTQGTFMGSYRLTVEECKPFGDDTKPRAWSKYAKDSSAYKRKHGETDEAEPVKRTKPEEPVKKEKKDPKFEEFLAAKGEKVEKAANEEEEEDMSGEGGGGEGPTDAQTAKLIEMLMEGIEGDTQLSLIFTGLPPTIKQKNVKEWLAPIRIKALRVVRDAKFAASFVTFNRAPDVRRALPRDGQFLGGFKIGVRKVKATDGEGRGEDEEKKGKQGGGKMSAKEAKEDAESRMKEEERVREQILDTGRLFLRNLPFSTKEEDLQFAFKKFGEVADVQVIVDKKSGACKGIAIVEFVFPESAVAAYAALDGRVFKGRMMHILPGAEKRVAEAEKKEGGGDGDGAEGEEGEKKASFKKEKATKMKANAAKSTHSWNALFLGANAVADSLAEKLGVSKADLLNAEDGASAGVRLALAETRLVRETRDFLVENGIQLDAFSRPAAKRSSVVMLAKNLPAGVEAEELERMFGHHGDVEQILLPPEGGVTAIIRMANAVDAKKAFQALAYTRFRTQPLYLEWAPHDVFERDAKEAKKEESESVSASAPDTADEKKTKSAKSEEKKKKGGDLTADEKRELRKSKKHRKQEEAEEKEEIKQEVDQDDAMEGVKTEVEKEEPDENGEAMEVQEKEEEEETVIEPNSAVFVKNLSFETDDESLTKLFSKYHIKKAQVSRKLDPARPGQGLSMGFGFVQFYTTTDAKAAIKQLQGALLDGHCIELKLSHRELDDKPKAQRKQIEGTVQGQCTKILVRNIPFQAKAEEVEQLFQTFGEVKNIRVPRKVGSRAEHRGFGFVDFLSIGEAKRAMEALCHSTHLYGRRLVLEWAKADDSVQEMRDKTKDKYSGEKKAIKKQKKQMEMIEKDLAKIGEDDDE